MGACEDGHERVQTAFAHQGEQLIELLEMCCAHPLGVRLEEGPYEHEAQVIGAQGGNCIEIALNGSAFQSFQQNHQLCDGV